MKYRKEKCGLEYQHDSNVVATLTHPQVHRVRVSVSCCTDTVTQCSRCRLPTLAALTFLTLPKGAD